MGHTAGRNRNIMVKTFEVFVPLEHVGIETHKDVLKQRLLINIFEILAGQELLSAEENDCLKVELSGQNKKIEYAKSRNL